MEGVWGPRSDMMGGGGGSYKYSSRSFSSCIQDMRWKE